MAEIALVGLALSAVGTGVSVYGASQAAAASKKQQRATKAWQENENRRAMIKQTRDAQRAAALGLSAAANQGVSPQSSGILGGQATVSGFEAYGLGGIFQTQGFQNQIYNAQLDESSARGMQATGNAAAGFGNFLFGNATNIQNTVGSWFGPAGPSQPDAGWTPTVSRSSGPSIGPGVPIPGISLAPVRTNSAGFAGYPGGGGYF